FTRPFDWESFANGLKVKYQICGSLNEVIHQAAIHEPALIIIILGPKLDPQEIRLKLQAYLSVSPEVFFVGNNGGYEPDVINLEFSSMTTRMEPFIRSHYIETALGKYQGLPVSPGDIILGTSQIMRNLFIEMIKFADSNLYCLIGGDTGVGKTLVAKGLHFYNREKNQNEFEMVDIGRFVTTLFEAEVFGSEKGAYSGADRRRDSVFEKTQGTIFFDEIGNWPIELQPKLLCVLQDRQYFRVGSNTAEPIDARLVFGTNENLDKKTLKREFRSDLLHRINTFEIKVPSLRERRDDIPLLIKAFTAQWNKEQQKVKEISPEIVEMFLHYEWPGNVRELRNTVCRVLTGSDAINIKPENLPPRVIKDSKWYSIPFVPHMTPTDSHPEMNQKIPIHVQLFESMKKRDLKKKDLAEIFDVSPATISHWLKGISRDSTGKTREIPLESFPLIKKWIDNGTH
ncbi:MAG: sigma-54-dependent transcriptional regulator, partial [Nitrospiria bacterium]